MVDYLSQVDRKKIIDEIVNSEENKRRKEESLMALEIFKGRQDQFILSKIFQELGREAALKSRTVTSVNLTRKIIKEQSQLYKNSPERTFTELNDVQLEHALKLYSYCNANQKFKKSNEIYKLQDQACMQIVLRNGKLEFRPLYAHHYDVIPKADNPEEPEAYIISSFDKWRLFSYLQNGNQSKFTYLQKGYFADFVNQKTADPDDYKGNELFYWWTKDYNFITNKAGEIVDDAGNIIARPQPSDVENPIGMLPFVDIANDKDFEFYVRSGYNAVNFTIDLGVLLSDIAEIIRLQGFSQAIIESVEEPKDLNVGPRKVLWLKIQPNADGATRPKFAFTSPTPDLGNSLQFVSNYLSMFLTSQGQSPKLVNAQGQSEQFTSGVDRFLSMLEKFEMSQDDINLYHNVEREAWKIIKAWNNTYYTATDNGFNSELTGVSLPEESKINVKFHKPQMLLSETDKLDLIQKKLDLGIMSKAEAVAMDREIPIELAEEIVEELNEEENEIIEEIRQGGEA